MKTKTIYVYNFPEEVRFDSHSKYEEYKNKTNKIGYFSKVIITKL